MLSNIINIYFLGIGGIGMSALARWCHIKNFLVQGWDDNPDNPLLNTLFAEGIEIHNQLKKHIFLSSFNSFNKENTILIYTPAISMDHDILNAFNSKGISIYKRSELLQFISKDYQVVAIAGTHGKTTMSIMLSHILKFSGIHCNAFFGGISKNYNTNFMIGNSDIMVIEADEYDKSFLKLEPKYSLISALDKDHGDIYKSYDDMLNSYQKFMHQTTHKVIGNKKLDKLFDYTYSSFLDADIFATNIESSFNNSRFKDGIYKQSKICFSINFPNGQCVQTGLFNSSYYNVDNAIGAASLAFFLGVSPVDIGRALLKFRGIKRRWEYQLLSPNLIFIDDYAHHPEELKALINNVRKLYKNRKVFLIFQPHLFSRTKELEDEFISVLSSVDQLLLLDIYPAREIPIPGVNSQNLLKKIDIDYKWKYNNRVDHLKQILLSNRPEILLTAGAGDIYKLIPKIKDILL